MPSKYEKIPNPMEKPSDEANPEGNREGKSRVEQMAAACIHRLCAQMDEHPRYLTYGARAGIQVDDEGVPPGILMLTMVLEYVITPPMVLN